MPRDRPECPPRRTPGRVNGERVKALRAALALLALVCFTISGCGSSKQAVSGPITVTGATTISNVQVGTLIRCKDGPATRIPHWFGPTYMRLPGVPGVIHLEHRYNGSVTVSCSP